MSSQIINQQTLKPVVGKLVVVGIGLIGGSLAAGLKQRGACREVIAVVRNQATGESALRQGVADRVCFSVAEIAPELTGGDVIFIAVPTLAVEQVFTDIKDSVDAAVTLTDGASVKGSVADAARKVFGTVPPQLVLGHPIAGSEKSGVTAANPDLYEQHRVILTPLENTDATHMQRVTTMWQQVGAEVLTMSVAEHDEVLGATSHLPHAIAYSLVDTLAHDIGNPNIFRYAAGGFRDFTRIASSDPVMWHDIMRANRESVVHALDKFIDNLCRLKAGIESADSEYMLGVFTRAKSARDHFTQMLAGRALMPEDNSRDADYLLAPGAQLRGSFRVPGDKSISHRAIMLGSLAEGITEVTGFLEGEDALATLQAFRDMGVVIEGPASGKVRIHGVGLNGLKAPNKPLYVGNSGTSIRLLSGILAGQDFDSQISGDTSLNQRPMARIAKPLTAMGAEVSTEAGGKPPLNIGGGHRLKAIDYTLPVASAQVKSCILLAGLYAEGTTRVIEPVPTRDHTERMLQGFGYPLVRNGEIIEITGGGKLHATTIDVPGDISSAAFFMVAAAITPGSNLTLNHVGVNPTRIGVIRILQQMGADISITGERTIGGEPVADIEVRFAPLKGIDITEEMIALAIDEFPILCVAAACAQGKTRLRGAAELRVKESDRIHAMAEGLRALGVDALELPDGIDITGATLNGGEVDSFNDHRIAMAFAIAGIRATAPVRVKHIKNVATSFPGFATLTKQMGISLEVIDH